MLPGPPLGRLPWIGMVAPAHSQLAPEEQVTRAVQERDYRGALTALMDAYGGELYRHCLAVLGTEALAADVHQLVFVHAFRDLNKFRGESSFRTWLYAIARHRCLDALRARRRFRRRFETRSELPETASATSLEDVADARIRARALHLALEELPAKVRVPVVLRYIDDMSFAEIGEICNAKPATVQARVARALPVLRRYLSDAGLGGES